jgi:hypothetical protein
MKSRKTLSTIILLSITLLGCKKQQIENNNSSTIDAEK